MAIFTSSQTMIYVEGERKEDEKAEVLGASDMAAQTNRSWVRASSGNASFKAESIEMKHEVFFTPIKIMK